MIGLAGCARVSVLSRVFMVVRLQGSNSVECADYINTSLCVVTDTQHSTACNDITRHVMTFCSIIFILLYVAGKSDLQLRCRISCYSYILANTDRRSSRTVSLRQLKFFFTFICDVCVPGVSHATTTSPHESTFYCHFNKLVSK